MPCRRLRTSSGILRAEVDNLSNNEYYEFVIRAVDAEGDESEFSNPVSVTPKEISIAPPANLNAQSGDRMIALYWDIINAALKYKVYRYNAANVAWDLIGETINNTFYATGLENGRSYMFKVNAVDKKDRMSSDSAVIIAYTRDAIPPGAPTNVEANIQIMGETSRLIGLTWDASVASDFKQYNVYGAGGNVGAFQRVTSTYLNAYQHPAEVDETYSFYITSVDTSDNESIYSVETAVGT